MLGLNVRIYFFFDLKVLVYANILLNRNKHKLKQIRETINRNNKNKHKKL